MSSVTPLHFMAGGQTHDAAVADTHFQKGNAAGAAGRYADAIAYFDAALGVQPMFVDAYVNRGHALAELGRARAALASFDRALGLDARHTGALAARAGVLMDLNQPDAAMDATRLAMRVAPEDINLRKRFFWLQVAAGADDRSLAEAGDEVSRLSVKAAREQLRARRAIPDFRAAHDLAQTSYLLQNGRTHAGLAEVHERLKDVCARAPAACEEPQLVPLREAEIAAIARFREQKVRYIPCVPEFCLNPDLDWKSIERSYFASTPEVVVIDDFLSASALAEMQRYALLSAVWKSEYLHKYLGAFGEDGFMSPLHMRIAADLKERLPRLLAALRLEHLWGFKYAPRFHKGINVHADFARLNLNFWITPDSANLDPETGGLVVYDTPAPASWSFRDYNAGNARISDYLASRQAIRRRIPYRCNRAVLFNANLFHETDVLHFKDGYENQRINITYLFGRGLTMA